MKKIILAVLLLIMIFTFASAQEEKAVVRNNSFGVNVLGAFAGLILGSVDIIMEYQHAFSPAVSILVTPEVLFGSGFWGVGSGLGLNIYPMGKYLHGFYISILPYAGIVGAAGYIFTYFGGFMRLGYQWVFDSGFVLSLGGGGRWDNYFGIGPNLVLTLGYAW